MCPDGISIMALLGSEGSSSIRLFWVDAVNFEVFRNRFIPIKVIIWFFTYKGVQWVNWIRGVCWIIISGDIYVLRNWGLNSKCNYIDCIDSHFYRTRVLLGVVIKGVFGFLPWQKIWLRRQSVFWRGYWLIWWGYKCFVYEFGVQIYSWLIRKSVSNTSVSFFGIKMLDLCFTLIRL